MTKQQEVATEKAKGFRWLPVGLGLTFSLIVAALLILVFISSNDASEQRLNATNAQATYSGNLTGVVATARAQATAAGQQIAAANQEKENQRKAAEVQTLLLQAKATDDPELTLALTLEAYQRLATPQTEDALRKAVENSRLRGVMKNHTGLVVQLQWSKDGKRILTASQDGTARVWNAETGAELSVMSGHTGQLTGATFSPDEKKVLTTANDNTARIWDAATGKQLITLQGHTGGISQGAWSPDGTRLATASVDRTARIWDAETGQQITIFDKHQNALRSIEWDSSGQRILTVSIDRNARIWNAANGQEQFAYNGPASYASWLDPQLILVSGGGVVRTIDITEGNTGQVFNQGSNGEVRGKRNPGPNFDSLLTYSDTTPGTGVKVWDSKGQLKFTVPDFKDLSTANWSPDGKYILLASQKEGIAGIYSSSDGSQVSLLRGHKGGLTNAAWSSDGKRVVTAGTDLTVRVWEPLLLSDSNIRRNSFENYLKFSPDLKSILLDCNLGNSSHKLRIWDANSLNLQLDKDRVDCFRQLGWSPDGKYLLASRSGTVPAQVLAASSGQILFNLPLAPCTNCYGSWSPDGNFIVVHGNSNDGFALIADAKTGKALVSPAQYFEFVAEPFWSPDSYLVLNQKTGLLVVNPATGQTQLDLKKEQTSGVNAWSANGKLILTYDTVSKITRVRSWPDGSEVLSVPGEEGVAISPDGKYLVLHNGPNYSLREVASGKQLFKYSTAANASFYTASFSPDNNYWLVGSIASPGSGLNLGILSVKTGEVRANLQNISQYKWNSVGDKLAYLPYPGTKSVFMLDFTAPQSVPIEVFQDSGVLDVAWSPDGKTLLVLGTDYTLRKLSNDMAAVLSLAKSRLFTQQLTPEQLNQYLKVGVTTSSSPTLTPQL